jgi:hypothetical protein
MLYLSYYLLCFLFNNLGEQEGRTGSAQKQGGAGEEGRWPKQCIHMKVNVKMIKEKKIIMGEGRQRRMVEG